MKKFLIGLVVALIVIIIGLVVYLNQSTKPVEPVACTMEAKLCPDGVTSVGRQGPNCEFAKCPQVITQEMSKADWQTKLPQLKEVLIKDIKDVTVGQDRPIMVGENFNFTGTNGALIDLGTGGASTDAMAVVMMIGNQPSVMSLGGRNNFLEGGSVTHSDVIKVVPDKNLIYIANWGALSNSKISCDLKAYIWDSSSQGFVFDVSNTQSLKTDYCKNNPPKGDI